MKIPFLTPLLGSIISFLYSLTSNYMVSLILFAVIIKLILFPLGIKQQKNSVKQAALRPKEMAIRKKYAGRTDDATKKKLNEEIMQLYQKENFNPAAGCLPLLIQLPILFSLYHVITNPIEYILKVPTEVVKPFLEMAKELGKGVHNQIGLINSIVQDSTPFAELFSAQTHFTAVDIETLNANFHFFKINLLEVPSFSLNPLILIPIFTFVFAFISTKFIRKFTYQPGAADQAKTMAFMDLTMPLFSVYISFQVSAAIGIYWMIQNILGAVQQYVLYKMYPIAPITEDEIKEAELELKGKVKKAPKQERLPEKTFILSDRTHGVSPKIKERVRKGHKIKARRKI